MGNRIGRGLPLLLAALILFGRVGTACAAQSAASLRVPAGFAGVVLVAHDKRILLFTAAGQAGGRRIHRDDRFWIASTGKQFVAAAIMKLAEEGKVRLDDPIKRFFQNVPPDKAGITIRELLSHTSGLGQAYVSEEQQDRVIAVTRMLSQPLAGPPGSGFRYSNSNIQLAAAIVEVVSGLPYAQFAKSQLWDAAGLHQTGLAGTAGASAVLPTEGALPQRLRQHYWGEQGAYSTAKDLFRWYEALANGRVLTRASSATLFTPVAKIQEGHTALGWFIGETTRGSNYRFVRGNEDFGANSLLYAFPRQDLVIVILTHAGDAPDGTSWSREVLQSLEQQFEL